MEMQRSYGGEEWFTVYSEIDTCYIGKVDKYLTICSGAIEILGIVEGGQFIKSVAIGPQSSRFVFFKYTRNTNIPISLEQKNAIISRGTMIKIFFYNPWMNLGTMHSTLSVQRRYIYVVNIGKRIDTLIGASCENLVFLYMPLIVVTL